MVSSQSLPAPGLFRAVWVQVKWPRGPHCLLQRNWVPLVTKTPSPIWKPKRRPPRARPLLSSQLSIPGQGGPESGWDEANRINDSCPQAGGSQRPRRWELGRVGRAFPPSLSDRLEPQTALPPCPPTGRPCCVLGPERVPQRALAGPLLQEPLAGLGCRLAITGHIWVFLSIELSLAELGEVKQGETEPLSKATWAPGIL